MKFAAKGERVTTAHRTCLLVYVFLILKATARESERQGVLVAIPNSHRNNHTSRANGTLDVWLGDGAEEDANEESYLAKELGKICFGILLLLTRPTS